MPPDLRELLRGAAAVPSRPLDFDHVLARGRRRRRARHVGLVVTVVLFGLVAPLVGAGGPEPDGPGPITGPTGGPTDGPTVGPSPGPTPRPTVAPGPGPFAGLPTGWTELAAPPQVRHHSAIAWTGDALLMWGGSPPGETLAPAADGFAYDPRTRTWDQMAPSPLGRRVYPASAWTGQHMLVWGGRSGDDYASATLGDGAAYDPRQRTWRPLPPAPITPRAPLSIWTGQEFIVWGTAVRAPQIPRDGAAYSPATNSWRRISEAPVELSDAVAVWTGREMIVFGALLSVADNAPATRTAIGAAYNPVTDTWRRLPDSDLSPQASTAAWNGREMIAWDYQSGAAAYDPAEDRWRPLPGVPIAPAEGYPRSVSVGDRVFGEFNGTLVVHTAATDSWQVLPRPAPGDWWLELAPAAPVLLVLGQQGSSGSTTLLAYRPAP
jgi:hypothetical protein